MSSPPDPRSSPPVGGDAPLHRALALAGGATLHLIVGIKIMWGNITPYVTSHLARYDPTLTMHETLHVYTVTFLGQALTMYGGGKLEGRIGARYTALLGTAMIAGGTYLASMATTLRGMVLVFCQGLVGLGIGTAYSAPIVCCFRHFSSSKSLVTGVITTGTGAGPFLFNLVATAYVNRENWPVDDDTGLYDPALTPVPGRVPGMFRLLALCYAACGVAGASMLSDPAGGGWYEEIAGGEGGEDEEGGERREGGGSGDGPSVKFDSRVRIEAAEEGGRAGGGGGRGGARPPPPTTGGGGAPGVAVVPAYDDLLEMKLPSFSGLRGGEENKAPPGSSTGGRGRHKRYGSTKKFTSTHSVTTPEMIRDTLCWLVIASAICTGTIGFYVAATYKSFGRGTFDDDHFLTVVGSVGCLCSGASRTLWGALADRVGTFRTVEVVSYASPALLIWYTCTESRAAYAALVCALYALWGANYCLYPPIAAFLFGERDMGTNYGFIFFVFGVTSTFCIDLCGYASVGFGTLNLIFAAMGLVGGALNSHLRYLTTEVEDEDVLRHHRGSSSVGSIF